MKKEWSKLWCKSQNFGKTEKGRDTGEKALQNSGSAQRLSGVTHRKTSLDKAKKK